MAALCFVPTCAPAAVSPYYYVSDFGLNTGAVTRVTLTPISRGGDYDGSFLVPTVISAATFTNGHAQFTNITAGYAYSVAFQTIYSTTRRTNFFASTQSGVVNGWTNTGWIQGFATDGSVIQFAYVLTNQLYAIYTNSIAIASPITSLNFVNSGNTTVTGAVSGTAVTIGISSSGGGGLAASNSPFAGAFLTPTNSATTNVWTHDAGSLTNLLPTTFGAFYTNQLSVTGGVFSTFSYPYLTLVTNTYSLSSNAVVTQISAPNLTAAGLVTIDFDTNVTTIDLRSLTYVNDQIYIGDMDDLYDLRLDSLSVVGDDLFFEDNASLTNVSLPAFIAALGNLFAIQSDGGVGVPALTNFSAPRWVFTPGQTIMFPNCAMDASSVNHVLARGVASGVTNCTVDLSGGANAAPTGQGATDKATLISRGNSVTTN